MRIVSAPPVKAIAFSVQLSQTVIPALMVSFFIIIAVSVNVLLVCTHKMDYVFCVRPIASSVPQ